MNKFVFNSEDYARGSIITTTRSRWVSASGHPPPHVCEDCVLLESSSWPFIRIARVPALTPFYIVSLTIAFASDNHVQIFPF